MDNFFNQAASSKKEIEYNVKKAEEIARVRSYLSTHLASKTQGMNLFGTEDPREIKQVNEWIQTILDSTDTFLSHSDQNILKEEFLHEITSLGKLHQFKIDPEVSEIMVNAYNEVWVERKGKLTLTDVKFNNEDEVVQLAKKIVGFAGRRIDQSNPIEGARLPDGSRVEIVLFPIALKGTAITIRKFFQEKLKIQDLINFGTIDPEASKFLEALVIAKTNLIISGGTGTGKTTTLNIVSNFIPDGERVFTIEDTAELQLSNSHVLKMESRPENSEGKGAITIRRLIKTALRKRPDRIIVGEVRDGAAFDLLQACNTGHEGSMGTIHSNNPKACIKRFDALMAQSGIESTSKANKQSVAETLEVIVQISRLKDGSRKITHITQITGFDNESDEVLLENIYEYKIHGLVDNKIVGEFKYTGAPLSEKIHDKFIQAGLHPEDYLKTMAS